MTTYDLSNLPAQLTIGDVVEVAYTGSAQQLTAQAGLWKLECWGAQGGFNSSTYGSGGLGGYAKGVLELSASQLLYLLVGGQGSYTTATTSAQSGGYNGGGSAWYYGGSGGGATDIRLLGQELANRIIVAGGGGGAQGRASSSYKANGGDGGGLVGGDGEYCNGSTTTTYNGKGGTQTAGGACGVYSSYPATAGALGVGGDAGKYSSTTYRGSGGGGGGYFGGGGGAYRYAGGGGGSGYVDSQLTKTEIASGSREGNGLIRLTYLGLPAPNPPTAGDITKTSINLAWTSYQDASSYKLYMNGNLQTTTQGTSVTVNSLIPNAVYNFALSAVVNGIETALSTAITATTEYGYLVTMPIVDDVSIVPNPVNQNADFVLNATISEATEALDPDMIYSATFYSGEVW